MSRFAPRQGGTLILVAAVLLLASAGAWLALEASAYGSHGRRHAASDRALALAREALIAYAADRPITTAVGPGYLPCPDLDDDGWAEATCGSLTGDSGQEQRIGRLPWKTLGLPDLRDGYGERLWYAVSSKHKGLLNCAASRACIDMSPDAAIGTISVRDASGVVLHDGTSADITTLDRGGALAVVIAPGPALDRLAPFPGMATTVQRRDCAPGQCGAAGECLTDPPRLTAKCHPANYLDKGPEGRHGGEDNADFVDRNDAAGRTRNTNGFINGPVAAPEGRTAVNDRLTVIAYRDVMPRVMRRVALEVAQCLAQYAARPENTGRYPSPTPTCRQDLTDPSASWADAPHVVFGRVPDTPFTRTRMASGGTMLERWWRHTPRTPETFDDLPTRDHACRIAFEPDDTGTVRSLAAGAPPEEGRTAGLSENAWWNAWKPFVFYALAPAFRAENARAECGGALPCLDVVDRTNAVVARAKHFAVIVAGPPLALSSSPQRHGNGLAATDDWLEGPNARIERANPNPAAPECPMDLFRAACSDNACLKAMQASANAAFNDVVVAHPRN